MNTDKARRVADPGDTEFEEGRLVLRSEYAESRSARPL